MINFPSAPITGQVYSPTGANRSWVYRGDSWTSYPETGAFGATIRSLQNRTPQFSVLDYGALGDGSTDDTAAIQACIDAAAGNGICWFPCPTVKYNFKGTLELPTDTHIIFEKGASLYLMDAAATLMDELVFDSNVPTAIRPCIVPLQTGGPHTGIVIEGMVIDCNGANQSDGYSYAAISWQNSIGMIVSRASVTNAFHNLDISGTDRGFSFCFHNATGGRLLHSKCGKSAYDSCTFRGDTTVDCWAIDCDFGPGQRTCVQFFDDVSRCGLLRCKLDSMDPPNPTGNGQFAQNLIIHGSSDNQVIDCYGNTDRNTNWVIMGDTVTGSAGVAPRYADRNQIRGCYWNHSSTAGGAMGQFADAGQGYQYARNNQITNCVHKYTGGASRTCISLPTGVLQNDIIDNLLWGNGTAEILSIDGAIGVRVRGNTIIQANTTTTAPGVKMDGSTRVDFIGNSVDVLSAASPGININAIKDCSIDYNTIRCSGLSAATAVAAVSSTSTISRSSCSWNRFYWSGTTAILYHAGAVSGHRVEGNIAATGGVGTAPSFFIRFAAGQASSNVTIKGNDMRAATTALSTSQLDIRGGSIIADNLISTSNQASRNSGIGTISATFATVSHGCMAGVAGTYFRAPRASDIILIPTNSTAGLSGLYVREVGGSTFGVAGPSGGSFAWHMNMEQYNGS